MYETQGKEHKVAALVTLQSTPSRQDPQPEPGPAFDEPRRVQRLKHQLNGWAGEPPPGRETWAADARAAEPPPRPGPVRLVRTCVASMAASHLFGPMMAAEAQERGFYRAPRKASVSDGAAWAMGGTDADRWSRYRTWMRACWQVRVREVLVTRASCQARVAPVPEGEELPARDPRRVVAAALSYLGNNQGRMDYPRYRRAGLPITSRLVESLVGEFNARSNPWSNGRLQPRVAGHPVACLRDVKLQELPPLRPGSVRRKKCITFMIIAESRFSWTRGGACSLLHGEVPDVRNALHATPDLIKGEAYWHLSAASSKDEDTSPNIVTAMRHPSGGAVSASG